MFAEKYIQKNELKFILPGLPIHPETGIIIVIPCFNEPAITDTLDSLQQCIAPKCRVEVIILINHSENSSDSLKSKSERIYNEVSLWIRRAEERKIRFLVSQPVELPSKWAGAGLARKKGMDEAVVRFNYIGKPDGLLVSLDADTLVKENYLVEIEKYFQKNPGHIGATISFRHQLQGLNERHRIGILLYEKYLKYYKDAVAFTGYPFSIFTIGSAFVVTAGAYVKRGGMNRRKAGEDFYFLQNLTQQGRVGEINSTTVYPSARLSERVPFGTGPIMKRWMEGNENLTQTYSLQAFSDLKDFFLLKEKLYKISEADYYSLMEKLPEPVSAFLREDNFFSQINNLNKNCSSLRIFSRRFFQVFNAFKILKFLNFGHEYFYRKANLGSQVSKLMRLT